MSTDTLQRLYLELANIVPRDCVSAREIKLGKIADVYGTALLMIAGECADPRSVAQAALVRVAELPKGA